MTTTDTRLKQLKAWLDTLAIAQSYQLTPIKGDASFRRYFRLLTNNNRFIVMDAPPAKEDCRPFIAIAAGLQRIGLQTPRIIAKDVARGFLLLTDLGNKLYLNVLNEHNADPLYQTAFAALYQLQTHNPFTNPKAVTDWQLPRYDQNHLAAELDLFKTWFLQRLLGIQLNAQDQHWLDDLFATLITNALAQPQVCVHRDYHSRNLLQLPDNQVGIIDFQDAVLGPVTYDLVSLIRDCYIDWPEAQVQQWALQFYQQVHARNLVSQWSADEFMQAFNCMGIQRHMKAIGIFARLSLLYGKPGYLKDIPRTLNYLLTESEVVKQAKQLKVFVTSLLDQINSRAAS